MEALFIIVLCLSSIYGGLCELGIIVAIIIALASDKYKNQAKAFLWWALFPFLFPRKIRQYNLAMKRWVSIVLIFVSPFWLLWAFVIFCILLIWAALPTTYVPSEIDYHNADDLLKVTGVQFPEVVPIDSICTECYRYHDCSVTFVPTMPLTKQFYKRLEQACRNDPYWEKNSTEYHYYILPDSEKDFDRTQGSGWRQVEFEGEFVDDWDGSFIEVTIPFDSDTITLRHGFYP